MCDLGRITYRNVHAENRLETPLLKRDGDLAQTGWPEIHESLKSLTSGDGLALVSGGQSLEEIHLFSRIAKKLCGGRISGGLKTAAMSEGDDLLLDADRLPNRASLALLDIKQHDGAELASMIKSAAGPVLVYGGDPAADDPAVAEALKGSRFVYIGTHLNETAALATTVLPVRAWAEKDGIFVNRQNRAQTFDAAVPGPAEAVEDWRLLCEWLTSLDDGTGCETLTELRQAISQVVPGLNTVSLETLPSIGAVIGDADEAGEVHDD
jgi:predicted molibdopterin-dependent oxidoreductase YjgC